MKRWLAALLALLLLPACALAQKERPIAVYDLPDGAQVRFLTEAGELEAPQGMEGLYALMNNASWQGDIYLVRMPNGYAMASVSCRPIDLPLTPQQLLDLWPRIGASLSAQARDVNTSAECARVETCFGREMLHIETQMTVEENLRLEAEAFAFCRDQEINEIWAAAPAEDTFAPGTPEAALLEADRQALEAFVQSLGFPDSMEQLVGGVPYTARDGSFQLMIPQGSTVISMDSTQEEIGRVRQEYIRLNPEGADRAFDAMMKNLFETRAIFVFTQDMQGVLEIYSAQEKQLAGVTPAMLAQMAPAIAKSLQDRYDMALCMEPDERAWIDGHEHALMGYWLRQGELDLQLDLLVFVHEANWMYEVDVFVSEGNQEVRAMLHAMVIQSMKYTPPVNGLE